MRPPPLPSCLSLSPCPQRAEDFLGRAKQVARFAGGAFDFISVCPPYPTGEAVVSYEVGLQS